MAKGGAVVGIVLGVLVYLAFIGAMITLSVRWSRRLLKRKSDALLTGMSGAKQLGAPAASGLYTGAETEYEVNGQRVWVNARYVSRSFVRATLRIAGGPYPFLVVFPEGKVERFGKAIGLNREVQTGDKEFDDLAYLDTIDTDENVTRVVESAAVRGAISDLLRLGYKVQLSSRGVEAFQVVYVLDPVDGGRSADAVAALGRLAAALPTFSAEQLAVYRPARRVVFAVALMLSWFIGILIAGLSERQIARTLDEGLVGAVFVLGGGLVWCAYVLGLVLLLRGRTYAMRTLLISAGIAIIGVPMGGGALILLANQLLDKSSPSVHELIVLEHKRTRKSGCRLTVPGWNGADPVTLVMHHKGGDEVLPKGSAVTVRSHPGAFGWEWVEPIAADDR
jgi:hypothetical protein